MSENYVSAAASDRLARGVGGDGAAGGVPTARELSLGPDRHVAIAISVGLYGGVWGLVLARWTA